MQIIAATKFIVGNICGRGAMFASAMHSLAVSVNQGFVYGRQYIFGKETYKKGLNRI